MYSSLGDVNSSFIIPPGYSIIKKLDCKVNHHANSVYNIIQKRKMVREMFKICKLILKEQGRKYA